MVHKYLWCTSHQIYIFFKKALIYDQPSCKLLLCTNSSNIGLCLELYKHVDIVHLDIGYVHHLRKEEDQQYG